MTKRKHPMQYPVKSEDGCVRFTENPIISRLMDIAETKNFGVNNIIREVNRGVYDMQDYRQLLQLIGYSLSGYGGLYMVIDTFDEETAYAMFEEGETEDRARCEIMAGHIDGLREKMREGVAALYGKHPDDFLE